MSGSSLARRTAVELSSWCRFLFATTVYSAWKEAVVQGLENEVPTTSVVRCTNVQKSDVFSLKSVLKSLKSLKSGLKSLKSDVNFLQCFLISLKSAVKFSGTWLKILEISRPMTPEIWPEMHKTRLEIAEISETSPESPRSRP